VTLINFEPAKKSLNLSKNLRETKAILERLKLAHPIKSRKKRINASTKTRKQRVFSVPNLCGTCDSSGENISSSPREVSVKPGYL